ncbi:uncharacterized protein TRIVIDRAFT_206636 [Trichoderma virens Gv29-8]|uniref:Uncharacterized protein n=1 Tax=Hypocrea virens (strain Gv29-8 / FGSC 10586) TaxID=413071 RepID=G9NAW3_HYPVG|nr:uncharacterized protein TRIVIDRAFT_206636 [Trichoderma virens Gv29-8]EHK15973.1 hypothetical protein TRIVIDRAFT_206636 [Trichoderma virens Gv29-8]
MTSMLGRRCIDTTTTPSPRLQGSQSNAAPKQYRQRMATIRLHARLAGPATHSAGPSLQDRRPASPSPYRLAEAAPAGPSEIAQGTGARALGRSLVSPIDFGPQAVQMAALRAPPQGHPRTQDARALATQTPLQYGNWKACASLGRVAHTPAPWPRFSSPRDARYNAGGDDQHSIRSITAPYYLSDGTSTTFMKLCCCCCLLASAVRQGPSEMGMAGQANTALFSHSLHQFVLERTHSGTAGAVRGYISIASSPNYQVPTIFKCCPRCATQQMLPLLLVRSRYYWYSTCASLPVCATSVTAGAFLSSTLTAFVSGQGGAHNHPGSCHQPVQPLPDNLTQCRLDPALGFSVPTQRDAQKACKAEKAKKSHKHEHEHEHKHKHQRWLSKVTVRSKQMCPTGRNPLGKSRAWRSQPPPGHPHAEVQLLTISKVDSWYCTYYDGVPPIINMNLSTLYNVKASRPWEAGGRSSSFEANRHLVLVQSAPPP